MSRTTISALDPGRRRQVIATLTKPRLGKYLYATHHDEHQALRLYVLNTQVSAAFLADLHYVEIALRNKFDVELTAAFGECWFQAPAFLALLDRRNWDILQKAQREAAKHRPQGQAVPPGKVIAELSFGFWLSLTDSRFEHPLWVPFLHKAFRPRKPPKRSAFNQSLEKIRQLRNRVAHHEPIFHLDLLGIHQMLRHALELLCPATAFVMAETSAVRREVMALHKYCVRRGI